MSRVSSSFPTLFVLFLLASCSNTQPGTDTGATTRGRGRGEARVAQEARALRPMPVRWKAPVACPEQEDSRAAEARAAPQRRAGPSGAAALWQPAAGPEAGADLQQAAARGGRGRRRQRGQARHWRNGRDRRSSGQRRGHHHRRCHDRREVWHRWQRRLGRQDRDRRQRLGRRQRRQSRRSPPSRKATSGSLPAAATPRPGRRPPRSRVSPKPSRRSPQGKTIWMMAGTHSFSQTVSIPRNKVGTRPRSPIASRVSPTGARPVLDFAGVDRSSEIRGLQLDASYWHLRYLELENASDNCLFHRRLEQHGRAPDHS